jgi:putative membrane protein
MPSPNIVDRATSSDGSGGDRTRLADERTYLAWLRSGLSAFAVSLGAGKIVPALAAGPRWPYQALGGDFAIVGVALVALGYLRRGAVAAAIGRGDDVEIDDRTTAVLVAVVVVLGLALTVVVVAT